MRALLLSLLAVGAIASARSQTPMPIIVPAMTPATVVKTPAAENAAGSAQAGLKALQALKAANDEILKQQTATLQKLDEIEKAANEIRIYSKRG
jgi:hypothetical protein